MAKITFLGGEETGDVAFTEWKGTRFTIGQPVDVTDPHMIKKARNNRFYRVDDGEPSDPMARARAAKAAKRAAEGAEGAAA